jgi:hypothetical protein
MNLRLALAAASLLACVALAAPSAAPAASTTWLCKPGLKNDPCTFGLDTTRTTPSGKVLGTQKVRRARDRKVDCFYVYPTVSDEKGPQASKAIRPELRAIARFQAARYSRDCRVFAPVYRQITLQGIGVGGSGGVTAAITESAYRDVRDAWREYLRRDNDGRGVVLIGHSQGTFQLRRLIKEEIDPKASARRRLVSALLLGGNVLVRKGSDRGGDFKRIRACRSRDQLGCVVAFSIFNAPVPEDARFGRTGGRSFSAPVPGTEVLCTNPAALGGGSAPITPVFPTEPFPTSTTIGLGNSAIGFRFPDPKVITTPWVSTPRAYRASCSSKGGADVLQVKSRNGAPVLTPLPDPTWGLHLTDANLPLGNLADLVRAQARNYVAAQD